MTLEADDLEELTAEIRKLIESNKAFLDRVVDEDYDGDDEAEGAEADLDDDADAEGDEFEEL